MKNTSPGTALSHETLFSKSKVYIGKALRRKEADELDEYQLWASLGLELLGKAVLSRIHPSLVVDPTHAPSLFVAAGVSITADVKTINAHTVFERLRHLGKAFDEKAREFCVSIAQRRNAELHSGDTPFQAMRLDAWEARYWHSALTILEIMDSSLEEWLGAREAKPREELLEHAREARGAAATIKIERHKEAFEQRKRSEKERALADAENKECFHYGRLFTLISSDKEWSARCPSCGGRGFCCGVQIGEQVIDKHIDEDDAWEDVEREYSREQFRCPVCNLFLDGVEELEVANLDAIFTLEEQREMAYEPDYDNE